MKVLMLHNKYKIGGGEDVSTATEAKMLLDNGIDLEIMYVSNDSIDNKNLFSLAANTIWSNKYYKEILNKVKTGGYDIVHVQNFFPLFSPSIFHAANKAGAKVVMSVRNYRLICPSASLFTDNKICFDCVGKTVPINGVFKKCYRNSYLATGVVTSMLSFHNVLKTWHNKIDGLICISNFVKDQLVNAGFDGSKMHVKYNFVDTNIQPSFSPEEYYIYIGRISEEKGILLLLDSFKQNNKQLVIIGDGPLQDLVKKTSETHSNITYLGKQPLEETYKKVAQAKALVFTSQWHEPFGRTIIESFAHGTPVIGSALGGVTELIKNGENGVLFNPNSIEDLNNAIIKFENLPDHQTIRNNAYQSYLSNFQPKDNFKELETIYKNILAI